MFDDSVTKAVFWISVVCAVVGLISLGALLSAVFGALAHG